MYFLRNGLRRTFSFSADDITFFRGTRNRYIIPKVQSTIFFIDRTFSDIMRGFQQGRKQLRIAKGALARHANKTSLAREDTAETTTIRRSKLTTVLRNRGPVRVYYYYIGITVTGRARKIANDFAAFLRLRFSDGTTTIRKSISDFTAEIGIDSKNVTSRSIKKRIIFGYDVSVSIFLYSTTYRFTGMKSGWKECI